MITTLTLNELKEFIEYNPETGVFIWLVDRTNGVNAGDIAGSINKRGYIILCVKNKKIKAHHLAWFFCYGKWPAQIDHINQIKSDNKIANLREVTASSNAKNKGQYKRSKTGVNGVTICPMTGRFKVQIRANGILFYLGLYDDLDVAKAVRLQANIDHGFSHIHGDATA